MSDEATVPHSVVVPTCSLCGQPWDEHLRFALAFLQEQWNEEQNYDSREICPITLADVEEGDVEAWMCVRILKEANRGPMGYQGPAGIPGETVFVAGTEAGDE